MSRLSRRLAQENNKTLQDYNQGMDMTSVSASEPQKPQIGTGRRPMKEKVKYPLFIIPPLATIVFFGNDIADFIKPDQTYEDWSISTKPNGDSLIPERKVAEKAPTPSNFSMEVDDEKSLPVCKGLVFIDKTRRIKIYDPVVSELPNGQSDGVFPRRVTVAPNNGSIEIGSASKPTDYEWILGNGAVKMTVPSKDCAEHQVRASQFSNGPNKNDTLRLHEDGYEAYGQQPVEKWREGLVHYTEPYRP